MNRRICPRDERLLRFAGRSIAKALDLNYDRVMSLIASRMNLATEIGAYKKRNNIYILQTGRWTEILDENIAKGNPMRHSFRRIRNSKHD